MKVYKFIFLVFLSFTALSCTSVSPKEFICNINYEECNKVINYCSITSDKDSCIEQLMFQLNFDKYERENFPSNGHGISRNE